MTDVWNKASWVADDPRHCRHCDQKVETPLGEHAIANHDDDCPWLAEWERHRAKT